MEERNLTFSNKLRALLEPFRTAVVHTFICLHSVKTRLIGDAFHCFRRHVLVKKLRYFQDISGQVLKKKSVI